MARTIILDCDPGHDDAIAMLLAAGSPEIEVAAITTVSGNQTLQKVTENARSVARIAGLDDVPIAAGMHRPLVRPVRTAPGIHGDSGLDGPELPVPVAPLDDRHAVELIIDTIMSRPVGAITLVPTGPLTNIAMAARLQPRIVDRVREVVLMGGGYATGNWSATSEFNIVVDPEAAHIVLNESWPLTMVGLDLTHQALATQQVRSRLAAIQTAPARFAGELLDFFARSYRDAQGFDAPPVHDACAVAYAIDPSIMTVRRAPLDVELTGTLTLGMTVADFRAPAPDACTTQVAVELDAARFWDLVIGAIARL